MNWKTQHCKDVNSRPTDKYQYFSIFAAPSYEKQRLGYGATGL